MLRFLTDAIDWEIHTVDLPMLDMMSHINTLRALSRCIEAELRQHYEDDKGRQ